MILPAWNPAWSETAWDYALARRFRETMFDLLITSPLPATENLAFDAALLHSVASGARGPSVWFWDWAEAAVILGSYQSVMNEFDANAAGELGFALARRVSGGGAMVVEPGKTITYSVVVPESFVEGLSFVQSFAFLDHWVVRALRALGIPATYKPINDIAAPDGKIAGAAQCRRRHTVLHHTAMAFDLDNHAMRRLLRHGQGKPSEKGIASAEKRVAPLCAMTTLRRDELAAFLRDAFAAEFSVSPAVFTEDERNDAKRRRTELADASWLFRVR